MGLKDAIFLIEKSVNVKNTINEILKNPRDNSLFDKLKNNFVLPNQLIIQGTGIENYFKCEDLYYNFSLGGFCSNKFGFAQFLGVSVQIISPLVATNKNMFLYLILPPLNEKTSSLTTELIMEEIDKLKIKTEVKKENIEKAINIAKSGKGFVTLLTKGKEPINGSVYKVKLYFNPTAEIGQKKEDGSIDFKERHIVKNIKKGEILGEYTPEIKTEDGYDIFGNRIEAKKDTNYTYIVGNNIQMTENNKLVSLIDGIFQLNDKTISISDTLVIPQDIDLTIGNINCLVSVHINGKINQGFKIEVGKDLIVDEFVNRSDLKVLGNLKVKNGLIGEGDKYKIIVRNNIDVEYIENCYVWCGGDINFDKNITHSTINCGGKIIAKGKGVIIGGKILASKGIEINELGSKMSVATAVIVGIDIKKDIRKQEIEKKLKLLEIQISKLKNDIGDAYFNNPEDFITKLPDDKLEKYEILINNFTNLMEERKNLLNELEELNKNLNFKDAKVIVRNIAYENVSIYFGNTKYEIKNPIRTTVFFWDDKEKKIATKLL
ncbi:MAG: FapA family protein [Spirochaetes bacterium]|nr:FapA family protein [Spirochaetota bacterium]